MPQRSLPGTVLGTVGYMSPEQAQGRVNEIDHRSDVFSFGCILFEAATAKKPFEGKDPLDALHKTVYAPTPQIKSLNTTAPDQLQWILRRCLAKEPEKRYQSIQEVVIELEQLSEELKETSASEGQFRNEHASATENSTGQANRVGTLTTNPVSTKEPIPTGDPGSGRTPSSAEYLVTEIKRHKRGVFMVLAVLVAAAAGVGLALYNFTRALKPAPTPIFQNVTVSRITTSGTRE